MTNSGDCMQSVHRLNCLSPTPQACRAIQQMQRDEVEQHVEQEEQEQEEVQREDGVGVEKGGGLQVGRSYEQSLS